MKHRYLALALLAACINPDDEHLSESTSELTSELWPDVAVAVPRMYNDAKIARVSYATPSIPGCSATMIGPNILMTAAHCGASDVLASFRTYRDLNPFNRDGETFQCDWLLNTFCDSDASLYFCRPNALGENPGDKYGYLDIDPISPAVGRELYSVWSNSISSLGIPLASIYSKGKVTATNDNQWYVARNNSTGIAMDLWGQPGASGSSHVDPSTLRIVVGPLSLAPTAGGKARWAGSMNNIMYWGRVDKNQAGCPSFVPYAPGTINALGLVADDYLGWIDADSNWLFDIQEDLEKRRGENARDWYWLDFASERKNALWDRTSAAQLQIYGTPWALLTRTAAGREIALDHRRLNLVAGQTYRASFKVWVNSASGPAALSVAANQGATELGRAWVNTSLAGGWRTYTFAFTPSSAGADVRVILDGPVSAYLRDLHIVREYVATDFDLADSRAPWINANTSLPALILPDGYATYSGMPDWAGRVDRDDSRARANDWPLSSDALSFVPYQTTMMCFSVKTATGAWSSSNWGRLRVQSAGATVMAFDFAPSTSWTTYCTPGFTPTSADTRVDFGVSAASGAPSYLVDDVWIFGT